MLQRLRSEMRHDQGASAVEYGLIVVAIATVIVAIVFILGGLVRDSYSKSCGEISSGFTNGTSTSC